MNRFWMKMSLTVTFFAVLATVYVWLDREELMPDPVPTHWGMSGEVDATTPRDSMLPQLLIMPGVMLLMTGLAVVLPWASPKPFSVDEFRSTFDFLMALSVLLMAYLGVVIVSAYCVAGLDITRWIIGGMFMFFAALGNQLGRVRRNFWMGIRTPWTLASDQVWDRTHRLAAWLFVAVGIVGLLSLALPITPIIGCIVLLVFAGFTPAIYSLVLYKRLERQGKL